MENETNRWLEEAERAARQATCTRAWCGAVLVSGSEIVGRGFNSPPDNDERERRCDRRKSSYDPKVTDKTCCVHAEQRAVMDALAHHPGKLRGSVMYMVGLLPDGRPRSQDGEIRLYCTVCTKMMRDVGVAEFVLRTPDGGSASFSAEEYLQKSYEYQAAA
ncbi:MAG: hypothetical protein ABIJ46_03905 [bacterium]